MMAKSSCQSEVSSRSIVVMSWDMQVNWIGGELDQNSLTFLYEDNYVSLSVTSPQRRFIYPEM